MLDVWTATQGLSEDKLMVALKQAGKAGRRHGGCQAGCAWNRTPSARATLSIVAKAGYARKGPVTLKLEAGVGIEPAYTALQAALRSSDSSTYLKLPREMPRRGAGMRRRALDSGVQGAQAQHERERMGRRGLKTVVLVELPRSLVKRVDEERPHPGVLRYGHGPIDGVLQQGRP